jgi:hypothetical protein
MLQQLCFIEMWRNRSERSSSNYIRLAILHLQRTTFINLTCKLNMVLITALSVAIDIFVLMKHGATGLFNFKSIRSNGLIFVQTLNNTPLLVDVI